MTFTPGQRITARSEDFLINHVDANFDGSFILHVEGLSELVKGRRFVLDTVLDPVQTVDPGLTELIPDTEAPLETDVITAMALGLTLEELILIYNVQFPVLQQNEDDTWYDTTGHIVFTCSKGLTGVGVDRPVWESIRHLQAGETYVHTITKSELY